MDRKNDWLVTWTAGGSWATNKFFEQKEECQYVADVLKLIQKEVICVEDILKIVIEPINREVQ